MQSKFLFTFYFWFTDRIEDNLEKGQIAVTTAAEELGKAKESKVIWVHNATFIN